MLTVQKPYHLEHFLINISIVLHPGNIKFLHCLCVKTPRNTPMLTDNEKIEH